MEKTDKDTYPLIGSSQIYGTSTIRLEKVGTDLEYENHSLMAAECEAGPFALRRTML